MRDRFAAMPSALASRSRLVRLAADPASEFRADGVPTLLAHPDWTTSAPTVLWMHGRTVSKEIDPGRYLRWIRAGIAACAIDLPGHGERSEAGLQDARRTLDVVDACAAEIDHVVAALSDFRAADGSPLFDTSRMGIGGMSAGGMVTLRRLCDPHGFVCASVESSSGDFSFMPAYRERYAPELINRLDPMRHIRDGAGWRPIPLQALHSEADEWVPVGAMRSFLDELARVYREQGANPDLVQMVTWPTTGAPYEHAGFGRVSNDAKNLQTAFFTRWLAPRPGADAVG